jgi:hypothetical protein
VQDDRAKLAQKFAHLRGEGTAGRSNYRPTREEAPRSLLDLRGVGARHCCPSNGISAVVGMRCPQPTSVDENGLYRNLTLCQPIGIQVRGEWIRHVGEEDNDSSLSLETSMRCQSNRLKHISRNGRLYATKREWPLSIGTTNGVPESMALVDDR